MKKKLKIAVEISGHLRLFQACAPLLKKNLLDLYDCDVFIHTWHTLDHQKLSWHGKKGSWGGGGKHNQSLIPVSDTIKKEVNDAYKPKAILYDDESKCKKKSGWLAQPDRKKKFGGFSLQAVWNTLYTEVAAHKLMKNYAKKNKIKYDFIIRTRPDIAPLEPFIIAPYLPFFNINPNTAIFFPSAVYITDPLHLYFKDFYLNFAPSLDVFYLTNPSTMDKMMNILNDFDFIFKTIPNHLAPDIPRSDVKIWNVEYLWLLYMNKIGVSYHFGKLSRLIKRFDEKKDHITMFSERMKNISPIEHFLRKTIFKNPIAIKNPINFILRRIPFVIPLYKYIRRKNLF
ncbi:MAG: hypothetical protein ACR2NY_02335 [Alphaproteobacteria bacterium]